MTIDTEAVNSKFLAKCFGMTERQVQNLSKNGVIPCRKKGRANVYDLQEAVSAYVRYLGNKAYSRQRDEEKDPEMRLKTAKADKLELEVRELRGHMYRAEDVEAVWNGHIAQLRGLLMALPGKLAQEATEAQTKAEAAEVIKTGVYQILQRMSQYEYDPEEYTRLIRERAGWDADDLDDWDSE